MKTLYLLLLSFSIFFLNCLMTNAQIRVESAGRVQVGTEPTVYTNDGARIMSLQLFGKNDNYGSGAKLSFGDTGVQTTLGMNAMVGEYGSGDSDQLWLHGKKGIFLTYSYGNSSDVIGYYDVNVGNRFNFNCDVYSSSVKLASDARFKENVQQLNSSLSLLQQLNGVSYNLNGLVNSGNRSTAKETASISGTQDISSDIPSGTLSEKEARDKAFFDAWENEKNNTKETHFGFLAQDLQQVFPDLVNEGNDGYLYVDYIGLIPVIVEGLKEQSRIIEAQNLKIKELEASVAGVAGEGSFQLKSSQATSISAIGTDNATNAFLYQNAPNPFTDQTEIRYFLPENTNNAFICIFNMQGTMLKKIPVDKQGSVQIYGAELQAGMYLYSLIVDGKEADTKRMILTR